jgi:hypothetical protein
MNKNDKEVKKATEGYKTTIAALYHELFPDAEGPIEIIKDKIQEKIVEIVDPQLLEENESLKKQLEVLIKENETLKKINEKLKAALDILKIST